MAYFPDLSNECQLAMGDDVRAIGWLGENQPFTTGTVDTEFLQILKHHVANPWTIVVAAGVHGCEFCSRFASSGNLIVPAEDFVYIAPEMIVHYIEAHNYKPPDDFIKAVIDCPEQESPEYMKRIQKYICHWDL